MKYMDLALRLARKADPYPNPRVGAVLVKDGKIIGSGYHRKAGLPHAEIEAMEDAKRKDPEAAKGAILYVTLEPCSHTNKRTPPCTRAIIANGIGRVVYAMKDPNPLVSGAAELKRAGVKVEGPTDQRAAGRINRRYVANIRKRPFVAIKMAVSADGRTATKTGDSKWISSKKSRDLVHRMRTEFDAVMVGAGTVMKDDPELTSHGKGRDPYRIIVDGALRMPLGAAVLHMKDGKTIIATSERAPENKINKIKKMSGANGVSGAQVFVCGKDEVDMRRLVLGLSAMGMKKILIEGGNELNGSAVDAGIVDRFYFFIAPKIIGGREAKGVIGGDGIERIKDAVALKKMKIKRIGSDYLIQADVSHSHSGK